MTPSDSLRNAIEARSAKGIERLDSPNWNANRFRWEFYVPGDIRGVWDDLSDDARMIALIFADQRRMEAALHDEF